MSRIIELKRIILSAVLILGTAAFIGFGATGAFFSDNETSTGNTFAAGEIDLLVDNESYYNLNKCTEVDEDVWEWVGEASYPEPGTPCTTSWNLADLDNGHLFFDFNDLKPSDEGEDTISLHVQNDAWACLDITLTEDDDVSSNDPELEDGDAQDVPEDTFDGELAQTIEMFWWADDGDNVYEVGENAISDGVQSLLDLAYENGAFRVALADSGNNVWGEEGEPLPAHETVYIAKAWCLGTLAEAAVAQGENTGPQVRGTGFTCDGTELDNTTQTDSALLDIGFETVQARHNDDFLCSPRDPEPEDGTITITKVIVGEGAADDFSFTIDGGAPVAFDVSGTNVVPVPPGTYDVAEVLAVDYSTTYANSENENTNCDDLVVGEGQNVTCTITNTLELLEPVILIDEDFGTGDCIQDIPGWEEDPGESCVNGTVAASIGTGDNTASPDGGRFALIGNDGYICRTINAGGLEDLSISYYWRGDNDGDLGENGLVQYATGGTCASPTGLTALAAHPLTTLTWQSNSIDLPDVLDNTTFFVRFASGGNAGTESFRVDGLALTATSI